MCGWRCFGCGFGLLAKPAGHVLTGGRHPKLWAGARAGGGGNVLAAGEPTRGFVNIGPVVLERQVVHWAADDELVRLAEADGHVGRG